MISVEEALEKILGNFHVLESEEKPILECLGQVLAEDISSTMDIPPWDNSAMDGFAVQADDTTGASELSPQVLKVIGEVAAGSIPAIPVTSGTTIRIMTGAPLPDGADAVVQFEYTNEVAQKIPGNKILQVSILRPARKGLNIRLKGEDVKRDTLVLASGTLLRPQEIGVLASLGYAHVKVIRRPVVAILSTGDEIADINQPLPPGKIYDSNTYSLAAQVLRYGGIHQILGIGRDTVSSLLHKIDESLDADMLITSGGVSQGDFDVVKDVLAKRGEISFWQVRMKPGKPLAFGVIRGKKAKTEKKVPHLGLPGNPVSSMITFEQFARPAILKMMGRTDLATPLVSAITEDDIINNDGRRVFARAIVRKENGQYYASLTGPQGSGILTSMAKANGLAIVPENIAKISAGDSVQVQLLDNDIQLCGG